MPVERLSSPPALGRLYPKALAGTGLAVLGRLPGLGSGEPVLPDLELELPDVEIAREHLTAYDRVCGFRLRDELPPTYLHVLAFPLAMRLMTSRSFPFPVVGLVHVRNRIVQRRELRVDERPTLHARAERLEPHERGLQFVVVTEATLDGEAVWRSESTYLRRDGGGGGGGAKSDSSAPRPSAVWSLPGDLGRRYAAVSGDRNPIHLHPLTARLFGMSRPIAHGMWTKARCLAALEADLPAACDVDVRFKLPVPLPARVGFSSSGEGKRIAFALHGAKSGKPHLDGSVEPA